MIDKQVKVQVYDCSYQMHSFDCKKKALYFFLKNFFFQMFINKSNIYTTEQ